MRTRLALGLTAGLALTLVQAAPDAIRAQGQAALNGQVTSEAEGAMEGVVVSARKADSIVTVSVTTDGQGRYQLVDVPFNSYLLSVEAPGFERALRELVVRSNLVLNVDVKLGVKPVTETVNVNSVRGDLLNLDKTAPSVVIDKNRIENFSTSQPSRSTEQLMP